MRLILVGFAAIVLAACGELDNFDKATKIIDAPDTIAINVEFDFRLTLRNDNSKKIRLTIDRDVTKSIDFIPEWYCNNDLILKRVSKLVSIDNDLQIHYLNKNDSLTYVLQGRLLKHGKDSLSFTIVGYDKVFRLKKPRCENFTLSLYGMWLPGDFDPFDAMLDYNFGQIIVIRESDEL